MVERAAINKEEDKAAISITVELNQLVSLQQRGFLSLDEFNQAKVKLLKN